MGSKFSKSDKYLALWAQSFRTELKLSLYLTALKTCTSSASAARAVWGISNKAHKLHSIKKKVEHAESELKIQLAQAHIPSGTKETQSSFRPTTSPDVGVEMNEGLGYGKHKKYIYFNME